jgi:hypothetical protein
VSVFPKGVSESLRRLELDDGGMRPLTRAIIVLRWRRAAADGIEIGQRETVLRLPDSTILRVASWSRFRRPRGTPAANSAFVRPSMTAFGIEPSS